MDGGGRRPKLTEDRLFVAVRYGGAVPLDVLMLQAAEAWGCPPWEIEAQPGAIRWLQILQNYRKALARAEKARAAAAPD